MSLAYRPQIDGLRAIAVLAVVGYHAELGPPAGLLGVDVFFVISGYLITSLLHREWAIQGDFVCDATTCPVMKNGRVLYCDGNHVSATAAQHAATELDASRWASFFLALSRCGAADALGHERRRV